MNGGTFDLNSHTQTVGTLSGTGGTVDLGSGALTVTQGTGASYAGVITGSGSLTKTGAGTLTLTGTNDYTGGTTVSDGTLAGTTDSLQGDILDNANVTFDQNTNGSYSGALTGSGSLTKNGNGTVTLLGSNNYGGGTIVNGGTLAGTTVTLQGDILDNANVTFNQSTTGHLFRHDLGQRQRDQGGERDGDAAGGQRLHRRHDHHRGQPAWHHGQPAGRYPPRCQHCQCHLRPDRDRQL